MHELGLCEAIVGAVEQGAQGRRVSGVRVRVGAQHHVAQDELNNAFSLIAEGTVAEGATVDMVLVPALLTCESCGFKGELKTITGHCPRCGSPNIEIEGGDELTVESVRLAGSNNG